MGFSRSIAMLVGLVLLTGCASADSNPAAPGLPLSSLDLANGAVIPDKMTCNGAGAAPGLEWQATPSKTVSFAVIARDVDSPLAFLFGHFVHWVLYDWPASQHRIAENLAKSKQFANGAMQGTNGFGQIGYGGPCPPGNSTHHYVFTVYALDAKLALPPGASEKDLQNAMAGHIIAAGELVGRYH